MLVAAEVEDRCFLFLTYEGEFALHDPLEGLVSGGGESRISHLLPHVSVFVTDWIIPNGQFRSLDVVQ